MQDIRMCLDASLVFRISRSVLAVFICGYSVSCYTTLTVKITPPSDFIEEMKQISLRCTTSSPATQASEEFPLSWNRTGGLPSSSSVNSSRQEVAEGHVSYQSTLTFTPTALDNQVDIMCHARVGTLTGLASYAPKIILVPNTPVITAPDRADVTGSYTWTCRSDRASQVAPNVYWRNGLGQSMMTGVKSSTSIGSEPNRNLVFSVTVRITLRAPTMVAGNSLSCIAVYELGQYRSRKSTFQVVDLAKVSKNGSDVVFASESRRETIACFSNSSPPATDISWTKDGQPVQISLDRHEAVNITSPSLTFLSVHRSDAGEYVCTVVNPVGSAAFTTPTTLIVRYAPTISYPKKQARFVGNAGEPVTLPCPLDSFPPPTIILWSKFRDGAVQDLNISSNPRYSGGATRNQQYTLTISPLHEEDAGLYFCRAVNSAGRGTGPNITVVVGSPRALSGESGFGGTPAVVFAVVSLFLLAIIGFLVVMYCCHCKCSESHGRARVSPFMVPSARNYHGGIFDPSFISKTTDNVSVTEDSAILPIPRTRPPSPNIESTNTAIPEMSEMKVHHLPPLECRNQTSGATLKWSAHLQPTLVAASGQAWRLVSGPITSPLDLFPAAKSSNADPTVSSIQSSRLNNEPFISSIQSSRLNNDPVILSIQSSRLNNDPVISSIQSSMLNNDPIISSVPGSRAMKDPYTSSVNPTPDPSPHLDPIISSIQGPTIRMGAMISRLDLTSRPSSTRGRGMSFISGQEKHLEQVSSSDLTPGPRTKKDLTDLTPGPWTQKDLTDLTLGPWTQKDPTDLTPGPWTQKDLTELTPGLWTQKDLTDLTPGPWTQKDLTSVSRATKDPLISSFDLTSGPWTQKDLADLTFVSRATKDPHISSFDLTSGPWTQKDLADLTSVSRATKDPLIPSFDLTPGPWTQKDVTSVSRATNNPLISSFPETQTRVEQILSVDLTKGPRTQNDQVTPSLDLARPLKRKDSGMSYVDISSQVETTESHDLPKRPRTHKDTILPSLNLKLGPTVLNDPNLLSVPETKAYGETLSSTDMTSQSRKFNDSASSSELTPVLSS